MKLKHLLALAPALALASAAASAQTPVRIGQTVTGRLEASDPKAEDDSHYDLYSLAGRRGDRVVVTLRSSDFDAYIAFGPRTTGTEYTQTDTDDDGGGGTDARLDVTLPADGTYLIRANTLSAGETGAYTLQVERADPNAPQPTRGKSGPSAVRLPSGPPQAVRVGAPVSGELTSADAVMEDGSNYDLYSYSGRRGENLRITMRSSAFDSYLSLGRGTAADFDQMESDDDGAGGNDSKIDVSLPEDGTYLIRANSLASSGSGAYTLQLERVAPGTPGFAGLVDVTSMSRIRGNQSVSGALETTDPLASDNTHYDDYLYNGKAGERLIITLSSSAFDAYLNFGRVENGKFSSIDTQDDGAGGTDSLMAITLPADGEYILRANSLGKSTGAYTLKVESTAPGARA